MSVAYEVVRFVLRLAVGLAVALAVAALWALARGGGFAEALSIACFVVGGLALMLAAAGGSPSRRDAASASWMEKWAFRGTFAENRARLPDTRLSTGAVFAGVAICLIALGVLLG
ncbi:MAG: hypothetical protein OEW31_09460 [Thermoleophilia bacterium]|nr:hypothetical protein [Thermoleophilia bacterium]MDH4346548.1 hypothetical protein [Thermoleophilia bacterium]MDH5333029.1 hypothetical protein [Thermoleophilia bacterium]